MDFTRYPEEAFNGKTCGCIVVAALLVQTAVFFAGFLTAVVMFR